MSRWINRESTLITKLTQMKVKSVKPTKDNKDKVDEIGMTLPKRKKKEIH